MGTIRILGFKRKDGSVGVRNNVAIMSVLPCVNMITYAIGNQISGAIPLIHNEISNRGQQDIEQIARTLAGIGKNPNMHSVLLVTLKCECFPASELAEEIAKSGKPVEILVADGGGTWESIGRGIKIAKKMVIEASEMQREPSDLSNLTLGIKCGGSGATSAIASHPPLGGAVDMLINNGGTAIFSETTEIIGAEDVLAKRAANKQVTQQIYEVVNKMKSRLKGLPTTDLTSGNINSGLSTLEEKSLGAIVKAGSTPIRGVLKYGEIPKEKGLYFMDGPARTGEVLTGLAAAGSQILVFSGLDGGTADVPMLPDSVAPRLTPIIKITGNPQNYRKHENNIDINAGTIIEGKETIEKVAERIYKEITRVASGKRTKTEVIKYQESIKIYTTGPLS